MAVKVGNLWKDTTFQSLDKNSKLLYLYLATNLTLSFLGVCCLNIQIVQIELSMTLEELRAATVDLTKKGYILTHNTPEGVYFAVCAHYMSLPKTENLVKKGKAEMETLAKPLSNKLSALVDLDAKFISFTEPSEQEIMDFAVSKGYTVDAKEFIRFYRENAAKLGKVGWYDGRGKIVKDWKGKLSKVWFKEDRKLKECPDAPKGFEYFHIVVEGKMVTPDYWRNKKPYSHEGIIYNKKLQEEYARKANS